MENKDSNAMMHQGKTIDQWVKDFKGEFTYDQLMKMAKGGCDLQKILMLGLDENETANESSLEDENAALSESIKPNYVVHVKVLGMNTAFSVNAKDEDDAEKQVRDQLKKLTGKSDVKIEIEKIESAKQLNESFNDDIVTVKDFVYGLKRNLANDNDKIMFRLAKDKSAYEVFDMHGKGGVFVVDLIPAVAGSKMLESSIAVEDDKVPIYYYTVNFTFDDIGYVGTLEIEATSDDEAEKIVKKRFSPDSGLVLHKPIRRQQCGVVDQSLRS